jgi:hypothetical protein
MHSHAWVVTKKDSYDGSIEEICGCGCGFTRWRGLSALDPSISTLNLDDPEQMWRDGARPDSVNISTLEIDNTKFDGVRE